MSSKFVPKGILLSSTPVQSPEEDSGYFGSNRKRNFCTQNTYSSIKEVQFNLSDSFPLEDFDRFSPQQTKCDKKVLDYEDFRNNTYESSSLGLNKFSELEFINDSVVRENEIHNSSTSVLSVLSFSEKTESQSLAFISSKNKDNFELFENKSGDSRPENFNGFKKPNNELSSSHANVQHKLQSLVFKQTKIDFIHCLNKINCLSLISCILSNLSAKELCIASCVNKEWKQIIESDCKANNRRKNFIKERNLFFNGPSKENRLGVKYGPARELKKAFLDLTNCNTDEQPLISKYSTTRFDSFMKESENGHLKLRKCPKCCYASKNLNGSTYKCVNCSHIFCSSCLDPVFKNHTCSKSHVSNIIIGSKKSKKNLKRL